jgi:hypothetical protein
VNQTSGARSHRNGDTLLEAAWNIEQRPLDGIILLICFVVLISPVVTPWIKKWKQKKQSA